MWGFPYLPAQLSRPGVGCFHFRGRMAFGEYQRHAQGSLQREFLLGALGRIRQSCEQFQSFREMTDRFHIGRTLHGALSCLLPVGNGLRDEASLGVVMGWQFGLGVDGLRKFLLQHLRYLLMQLLASALQQGLIRRLLHQSMLEEIVRLWRQPALIEQFSFD